MEANVQVAPAGQVAPTLRLTWLAKPKSDVRLMVEVLEPPCVTGTEVGFAEIEKSDTFTVNVVLWFKLKPLSVPLTVIV